MVPGATPRTPTPTTKRSSPVSRETPMWVGVAEELGHPLTPDQDALLHQFHDWLLTEALAAGGIGPRETDRIQDRHIADSLIYAKFFAVPPILWDLGSGVGLPGIPLAIMFPETEHVLIDRSGRRVNLMKRAIRVLGLDNVTVRQEEIARLQGPVPVVVSRASLPPEQLRTHLERFLEPGGVAVIGGSWVAPPVHDGWITEEVVLRSLDRRVWLLIMRRQ